MACHEATSPPKCVIRCWGIYAQCCLWGFWTYNVFALEFKKSADSTVSWSPGHEFSGRAEELALTQESAFILT